LYQSASAPKRFYEDPKKLYHIAWWRKYSGLVLLGIVLGICIIATLF
jgi:hypothetical protein